MRFPILHSDIYGENLGSNFNEIGFVRYYKPKIRFRNYRVDKIAYGEIVVPNKQH